jgi:putative spermidine/putrescine transport system permease protein
MTGEYRYIPPKPPLGFTVGILAGFGGLAGLMTAQGNTGPNAALSGHWCGALCCVFLRHNAAWGSWTFGRLAGRYPVLLCGGAVLVGFAYGVLMAIVGLYCRRHDLLARFRTLSVESAALCDGAASALVL